MKIVLYFNLQIAPLGRLIIYGFTYGAPKYLVPLNVTIRKLN